MNFGIGFGFGVDGLEAVLLSALQVLICGSVTCADLGRRISGGGL